MASKFLNPGCELTYKKTTAYYQKAEGPDNHMIYYFEDGWPFPKWLTVGRDQFTVKRLERETPKDLFADLGEALF